MFHQQINDLRNPGFGLWFALSLSKGKRTGQERGPIGQVKQHAGAGSAQDWRSGRDRCRLA